MNHVPPGPEQDQTGCGPHPPGGHIPERCHHSSLGSNHLRTIRGSEVRISHQAHDLETGGSSPPLETPLCRTGKPTMRGSTPYTEVPDRIYSPDLPRAYRKYPPEKHGMEMRVACVWVSGSDVCTYHNPLSCRPLPDCGFNSRLRLFLEKNTFDHENATNEFMHEPLSKDGCHKRTEYNSRLSPGRHRSPGVLN